MHLAELQGGSTDSGSGHLNPNISHSLDLLLQLVFFPMRLHLRFCVVVFNAQRCFIFSRSWDRTCGGLVHHLEFSIHFRQNLFTA